VVLSFKEAVVRWFLSDFEYVSQLGYTFVWAVGLHALNTGLYIMRNRSAGQERKVVQ